MNADDEGATTADKIAAMPRQYSKSGRLISEPELFQQFTEQGQDPSVDWNADFRSVLAEWFDVGQLENP